MKQIIKTHGYAVIKEKVMQFLRELREEKGPKNLKPTPTSPPPVSEPVTKPLQAAPVANKENNRSSIEIKVRFALHNLPENYTSLTYSKDF